MSVNYQNTEQHDVISELPKEIPFRVMTSRHHKTNRLSVSNQLLPLLKKNVSLVVEEQQRCLRGLQKLGISEGRQQSNLSNTTNQYGRAGLCHQIATIFQDGEINWQKIFQMLDYITDVIINSSHGIFLVDQLCHYSETIHVSSDGQTISDWISTIRHKRPVEEPYENQQDDCFKANYLKTPENSVLPSSDYSTKCSCGSIIIWSKNKLPFCTQCKAYLCPVEGCHAKYPWIQNSKQHLKTKHTVEQIKTFEVKRQQYELHHCKCGAVKPSRGTTAYKQCSTCHEYLCLKVDCSSQFRLFHNLHRHLRLCHVSLLDTKCAGCGGEKLTHKQITQCPNINCAVFWCGECDFVGKSFTTVTRHIAQTHKPTH